MKHKRPPIAVLILLGLVLLLAGYFLIDGLINRENGSLSASGTIEATSITISPEVGGKVVEVYVEEGDVVVTGDILFRLDDTLLQAQRDVAVANVNLAVAAHASAEAALASALANYDIALASAQVEYAPARTRDWDTGIFSSMTQTEEISSAQNEVFSALEVRDGIQLQLDSLLVDPVSETFVSAEARLLDVQSAFLVAESVLQRANRAANNDIQAAAQVAYDTARDELDDAQLAYDDLKDSESALAVLSTRTDLIVAQERYDSAVDRLLTLQTGNSSLRISAASAALRQAEAYRYQSELGIAQAQTSLDLIDVQISKLTITAPTAGIVQTRAIQPGEVITAGSSALMMVRLDDLSITVFIPEDRYGELSLGQSAVLKVDSFPEDEFTAIITFISNEAEFTPRNVQTVEGRSSTVYAIRLRVDVSEAKLKPGMPADITFEIDK